MKLIDILKEFYHDDEITKLNLEFTYRQLRDVAQERGEKELFPYHIYNSIWNRMPNFNILSVFRDKLRYALEIGSGLASPNQLPVSQITSSIWNKLIFLMKDRGHITNLVCNLFSKEFKLKDIQKVANETLKNWKSIPGYAKEKELREGVKILESIVSYVEEESKRQKSEGVNKSEQKLSLEMICDNVPDFDKGLNDTLFQMEVIKESIIKHMKEIFMLNNGGNPWIPFQKGLLDFIKKIMSTDGSDDYLRETLNLDKLSRYIAELSGLNGEAKFVFKNSIDAYKKKISEYYEPIALRFLALREYTSFTNRGAHYNAGNETDITNQLWALKDKNISYDSATYELSLASKFALHPIWEEFEKRRKELIKEQLDTVDTGNLKDSAVGKEDMGMAYIDLCMEARMCIPGMGDRTSDSQIEQVGYTVGKTLIETLEEIVEDETLLISDKSMKNRFDLLIIPTYDKVKKILSSNKKESKEELKEMHLSISSQQCPSQKEFQVIKFTKQSLEGKLQIATVNFETGVGIDLGRKKQSDGYTFENTFAQQKHHNRSDLEGDYNYTTIEYWKWYATENLNLVNDNKEYLFDNDLLEVITDAKRLNECFNGG